MRSLLAILAFTTCAACGTTATITRTNGPPVEGHITGGDAENLYVEESGARSTIPRSDIKDIDHPGDGATVAGAILMGYGSLNIAVGAPMCKDKGAAFCVGVFTPMAVGIPILLWGAAVHAGSVSAASTPPAEKADEAKLFVTPLIPMDKGQPAGAAVVGTF
jgi:hypothetical protein